MTLSPIRITEEQARFHKRRGRIIMICYAVSVLAFPLANRMHPMLFQLDLAVWFIFNIKLFFYIRRDTYLRDGNSFWTRSFWVIPTGWWLLWRRHHRLNVIPAAPPPAGSVHSHSQVDERNVRWSRPR